MEKRSVDYERLIIKLSDLAERFCAENSSDSAISADEPGALRVDHCISELPHAERKQVLEDWVMLIVLYERLRQQKMQPSRGGSAHS